MIGLFYQRVSAAKRGSLNSRPYSLKDIVLRRARAKPPLGPNASGNQGLPAGGAAKSSGLGGDREMLN